MRTLVLLSLALVAALLLAGCTSDGAFVKGTPTLPLGYANYTDSKEGFVIARPPGWRNEAPCCGTGAALFYPAGDDSVQIWVSRAYPDVPEAASARGYFDSLLLETLMPQGYERLAIVDVQVNGVPAVKHTYSYIDGNGDTIQSTDVLVKEGRRVFQVSCSAPADSFVANLATFERVLRTFTLLK